MTVEVVVDATDEPITLDEAKAQLRIETDADDAAILRRIRAARQHAEHECGRSFAPRTLLLRASAFGGGIELPFGPVTAVSTVKYRDASNVLQTLSGSSYYLDRTGIVPVVRLAYGVSAPMLYPQAGCIEVTYTAGEWAAAPTSAHAYMLLLIGSMNENREADAVRAAQRLPFVDRLLDPYRVPGV